MVAERNIMIGSRMVAERYIMVGRRTMQADRHMYDREPHGVRHQGRMMALAILHSRTPHNGRAHHNDRALSDAENQILIGRYMKAEHLTMVEILIIIGWVGG